MTAPFKKLSSFIFFSSAPFQKRFSKTSACLPEITLFGLLVLACGCLAQGQLNFANYGLQVNAPISDTPCMDSVRLAGPAFAADLYWGPEGTTDSSALVGLHQPAYFLTGAQAGYFRGGSRILPVPGGARVVVQVRAWDTADGQWYEAAISAGTATSRVGASGLFSVVLTRLPDPPADLVGLNPFALNRLDCYPPPPPPTNPPAPPYLNASQNTDSVVLSFFGVQGYHYTVEYSDSASGGQWLAMETILPPYSTMVQKTYSLTNSRAGFYRVRASMN